LSRVIGLLIVLMISTTMLVESPSAQVAILGHGVPTRSGPTIVSGTGTATGSGQATGTGSTGAAPGSVTLTSPTNGATTVLASTNTLTCTAPGATGFNLSGDFGTQTGVFPCTFTITAPLIGLHTYNLTITATNTSGSTPGSFSFTIESAFFTSPSGNDSTSCATSRNPATPKKTLDGTPYANGNGGLSCLSGGGDKLYVRTGTYDEDVSPNGTATIANGTALTASGVVSIVGYPGETATIKPSVLSHTAGSNGFTVWFDSNAHYISFDHLTIDGTSLPPSDVVYVSTNNGNDPHHIRFQNDIILGPPIPNPAPGGGGTVVSFGSHRSDGGTNASTGSNQLLNSVVDAGGAGYTGCGPTVNYQCDNYGIYLDSPNNLVDGNEIRNTAGYFGQIYQNVSTDPANGNIIRNNWFHDVNLASFSAVSGIVISGYASSNQVYNNVFSNLNAGATSGGATLSLFTSPCAGNLLYNNTIYNAKNGLYDDPSCSGTQFINNILNTISGTLATTTGGTTCTTNSYTSSGTCISVVGNPQFTAPTETPPDFRIGVTSAAKGTGTTESGVFTTDKCGNTRTVPWDLGAIIFGAPSAC
jgi:hypothetical protein